MNYVNLGRTGLKVSNVCLGTMTFRREADEAMSFAIMDHAVERGVNFFDTANVYSKGESEKCVGAWLKARGGRDGMVIATKVNGAMGEGPNDRGLSRRTVLRHCEDSLRRLGVEWIDLYQTHSWDDAAPIDETLGAMDDLVRAGKVRYVGCSNVAAWQLAKALWTSERRGVVRFDSLQPMYNLTKRGVEAELLPLCVDQGIGVIPYNPLAGGFLTGKYTRDNLPGRSRLGESELYKKRYWSERNFEVLERFLGAAKQRGVTAAQLSLAWVASHPAVTSPIVGASSLEQLKDSLAGLEIRLTPEERAEISRLSEFEWEGNLGR